MTVVNDSKLWRNISRRGADVTTGTLVARQGDSLLPTRLGLLAAAGHSQLLACVRPRVAIIATGDEVIAPGQPCAPGRLYASNITTLSAWCSHYGLTSTTSVVPDEADAITCELETRIEASDTILTSGGTWSGDRDLTVRILDELGWRRIYHRVRIGPGKGVAFGLWRGRPVFCLPGGPPSNHMAFVQLALPGLLKLAGHHKTGLPLTMARSVLPLKGLRDWTQFVHGRLVGESDDLVFLPMRQESRLKEMADTEAIATIPEGVEEIPAGARIQIQLLTYPSLSGCSVAA